MPGLVPLLGLCAGVLGLLTGSFLNVIVYRLPSGISIVSPPSACPRCRARIKSFDNVPVLSWLLLRGKCRNCKTRISARYPLVEAGTAMFFAGVAWFAGLGWVSTSSTTGFGSTTGFSLTTRIGTTGDIDPVSGADSTAAGVLVLVAFLYLAAVSVALALIDIDTHRLPDAIVLPSYLVGGLLLGAAGVIGGDVDSMVRAAIGMAALWAAYLVMAVTYPGGMGFGDVKLAGVLGLYLGYLGWGQLVVGAFAAFLLGGIFAVGLLLAKRANRKSGIPFGPWMLVGAWVGVFFGAAVWDGYLTLLGVA
ncbi:prepilin peptidase [Cryobacterium breve]|uniref:Prepilin leader peptidase/N-methyltransferase n=1 Tax=Cryobacterium breve TaxID=1259258 RepID=A0ABY2J282_9MICO|nr:MULTISPECIES: A24 family peptidase [Cryobacterium]TFC91922.1 prepilin peptidase [Cryobacterium sp. TmT3-12]TFC98472.1 prepilin peptidase [Cryobacterium breve]